MASYTVNVEKFNGEKFTDTVSADVKKEVEHFAERDGLGEKIVTKRVQFEGMEPETYHFYEHGRIRVRRDYTAGRRSV